MRNICLIWRGLAYVALVVASSIVICACGDDSSAGAKDNSQLGDSSIPSEDLEILGSCEDGLDGQVVGLVHENGETDYLCKSGTWTAISEEEAFCVLNPLLCREPDVACSAENDGAVEKTWTGRNPKYGTYVYHKCVDGSWKSISRTAAECDKEGLAVGDSCTYVEFYMGGAYWNTLTFVYLGNGEWEEVDSRYLKKMKKIL